MVTETLILPVIPPFRLGLTVWALRRRMSNIVDRWNGRQYTRVVAINGAPVKITVDSFAGEDESEIHVTLQREEAITSMVKKEVRLLLIKMLGLSINLSPFYLLARKNDSINPLVQQFLGVKPPRFPTIFEALINSIACQQVTLDVGILLINRLAENFGLTFAEDDQVYSAFPRPEDLAHAAEIDLRKLGFSRHKARAIQELALRFIEKKPDLSGLDEMTNLEIVEALSSLRGIGRWSAEYTLLRGFGRLDVFPGDDIGAKNNLQKMFDLQERPGYEDIKDLTAQWRPYEGLVYFHLLLEKLSAKGVL